METAIETTRRIVTVPAADDMDDKTFIKHFNLRHSGSLRGLEHLSLEFLTPYVILCYRTYHDWLHRPDSAFAHLYPSRKPDLDHDHKRTS